MALMTGWAREQARTYFDNASAKRDFRSQLRGKKAAWLFGAYLLVLLSTAYLAYQAVKPTMDGLASLEEAQLQLKEFASILMGLLGGLATFAATAAGATSVILERQRQALDLVLTAPVTSRYYLIGKLLSAYRLVWIMIVVALPPLTVAIALGGGSWSQILISGWILSLDCLLLAAVATAVSASVRKPGIAILVSFLFSSLIVSLGSTFASADMSYREASREGSVVSLLSPFFLSVTTTSHTNLFGYALPNWLLFTALTIPACWFVLACAGSGLSSRSTRETAYARAGLLVLTFAAQAVSFSNALGSVRPEELGAWFIYITAPFLLVIPYITCSGRGGEAKFEDDGSRGLRATFTSKPGGALSYSLLVIVASALGAFLAYGLRGWQLKSDPTGYDTPLLDLATYLIWNVGATALIWALSRAASTAAGSLAGARTIVVGLLTVLLVPAGIIAGLTMRNSWSPFMAIFPLAVLNGKAMPWLALGQGAAMLALAPVALRIGDRVARKRELQALFESGPASLPPA